MNKNEFFPFFKIIQDAYAEPGQDSRNIAGLEVVVIVQDVQDVPPIFTMAPPVTRLLATLLPGDKVREKNTNFIFSLNFHASHINVVIMNRKQKSLWPYFQYSTK